jgi:hypothetical protein
MHSLRHDRRNHTRERGMNMSSKPKRNESTEAEVAQDEMGEVRTTWLEAERELEAEVLRRD